MATEDEFARLCECEHATGVSNGTDVMQLAPREP
jgi:dTDP-4-amino-4,6-dideoxygalactose transaminase